MQLSPAILSLLKKPIGMYSRLLLETLGIKIKFEDGCLISPNKLG